MNNLKSIFPIQKMCNVLQISKSGYYKWKNRKLSKRAKQNNDLLIEIKKIHKETNETYGSPRIIKALRKNGHKYNKKRIEKLMKSNNIVGSKKKRYRPQTTIVDPNLPVAPNLLNQNFTVQAQNMAWVSDITYVRYNYKWCYLCIVLDLYSRKVVGWAIENHMKKELVIKALNMAVSSRSPEAGLIFHSDRGSQYASKKFQKLLHFYGFKSSMSRKGNCYDNAVAESFFSSIKTERISRRKYRNFEEAKQDIFQYIEVFYNRLRLHSYNEYLSPEEYEMKFD